MIHPHLIVHLTDGLLQSLGSQLLSSVAFTGLLRTGRPNFGRLLGDSLLFVHVLVLLGRLVFIWFASGSQLIHVRFTFDPVKREKNEAIPRLVGRLGSFS